MHSLHRRVRMDLVASSVLALLPREVVEETEELTIIRFAGLEPVVRPWTLFCFEVGLQSAQTPAAANAGGITVGATERGLGDTGSRGRKPTAVASEPTD